MTTKTATPPAAPAAETAPTVSTKPRAVESDLDRALRYQESSFAELLAEAKQAGITVSTTNKEELIELLTRSPVNTAGQEGEFGFLISLHSRTDEAKALIQEARDNIFRNEDSGQRGQVRMLLKNNNDGKLYTQQAPGVRVTQLSTIQRIVNCIALTTDGSQEEIFSQLKNDPEGFEDVILVRLRRRGDGDNFVNFVMLYARRKHDRGPIRTM